MKTKVTITALIAISSTAIFAAPALRPAAQQRDESFPFRCAVLDISNTADTEIASVRMRWAGGGPTMVFPAAVSPGRSAAVTVYLPACSVSQEFDVTLLDLRGQPIERSRTPIDWPAALVSRNAFIDYETGRKWMADPAIWPERIKLSIAAALAGASIGIAGALLIGRPALRMTSVAIILVSLAAGTWFILAEFRAGYTIDRDGRCIILKCRNTSTAHLPPADETGMPRFAPIYIYASHMKRDDTVIDTETGTTVPLKPGAVRIFRKTGLQ